MKQALDREGTGPDRNTADYRIRKAQVEIICVLLFAYISIVDTTNIAFNIIKKISWCYDGIQQRTRRLSRKEQRKNSSTAENWSVRCKRGLPTLSLLSLPPRSHSWTRCVRWEVGNDVRRGEPPSLHSKCNTLKHATLVTSNVIVIIN